ncbi:transposase, partial [Brevibacillus agri]|nr:transposase [Brevibacillus agri]
LVAAVFGCVAENVIQNTSTNYERIFYATLVMKYKTRKTASGLEQSFKIYECEECSDCPLKPACTKAKGNRQIHTGTRFGNS